MTNGQERIKVVDHTSKNVSQPTSLPKQEQKKFIYKCTYYMHFFVCLNYKILFLINAKIILDIILYAKYFGHGPVLVN